MKLNTQQRPTDYYLKLVKNSAFISDLNQVDLLSILDRLQVLLLEKPRFLVKKQQKPFNLYIWGEVGRGKTLLVDCFIQSLPATMVKRFHFYQLMRAIHESVQAAEGQANPLLVFAKKLATDTKVLVLDEFMVHDIVDAMILKRVLLSLNQEGIVLITTSNVPPASLYEGGLQRGQFLPAIAFIEANFKIYHLKTDKDYRLRALTQQKAYYLTHEISASELNAFFLAICPSIPSQNTSITIDNRLIQSKAYAGEVAWFDYEVICGAMRGPRDYLEMACLFHTVWIEKIPQLKDTEADSVRRFMILVDAFYDKGTTLTLVADVPLAHLYEGQRFQKEWPRIKSRLIEMQSEAYFKRGHRLR